jgi:hypothetical protein
MRVRVRLLPSNYLVWRGSRLVHAHRATSASDVVWLTFSHACFARQGPRGLNRHRGPRRYFRGKIHQGDPSSEAPGLPSPRLCGHGTHFQLGSRVQALGWPSRRITVFTYLLLKARSAAVFFRKSAQQQSTGMRLLCIDALTIRSLARVDLLRLLELRVGGLPTLL